MIISGCEYSIKVPDCGIEWLTFLMPLFIRKKADLQRYEYAQFYTATRHAATGLAKALIKLGLYETA